MYLGTDWLFAQLCYLGNHFFSLLSASSTVQTQSFLGAFEPPSPVPLAPFPMSGQGADAMQGTGSELSRPGVSALGRHGEAAGQPNPVRSAAASSTEETGVQPHQAPSESLPITSNPPARPEHAGESSSREISGTRTLLPHAAHQAAPPPKVFCFSIEPNGEKHATARPSTPHKRSHPASQHSRTSSSSPRRGLRPPLPRPVQPPPG